jgi:glycosyltransferase involved in cell wall biosynthesis
MKILQVNTVVRGSSVGRIMADLYQVIEASGNEARMAVGREPFPEEYQGILIGSRKDFYQHVMKNFFQGESGFGSEAVTRQFLKWVEQEKPDLIHLHNIHGFYLQIELLFEYIKKNHIPVVWTLHDCWSFTGHCAYYDFAACDKWKTGCHTCIHHAKVYPYALFRDNTIAAYARKRKAFCGVENLTIVTPSNWLKEQVQQSFLREYPVEVIPNGIDLEIFCPGSQETPKTDRKVILGVANIWELRKGLVYFEKLAADLSEEYQVQLIGVNRKQKKELNKKFGSRMIAMERTSSPQELAEAYRNAAVFVNATLEDNFPTTNLEALACGTPVVTYATGGSGEAVTQDTGIVVQRGNYDALLEAVQRAAGGVFESDACRRRAEQFDKNKRYGEYLKLYQRIGRKNSLGEEECKE